MFILYFLVGFASGQYEIKQIDIGCIKTESSTGKCTDLCLLGVEDCDVKLVQPKCEYGFFLFTLGSSKEKPAQCVQCPYQLSFEDLTKYCIDCVDDPYGWEFNRKCSYDYVVGNGIFGQGSYQKSVRKYPELFFVGAQILASAWYTKPDRSTELKYSVYICTGCAEFCSDITTDTSCHAINSDFKTIDTDKIGIVCVDGYFFLNNLCQSCSVRFCISCNDQTSCTACESGYRLSSNGKSCIKCLGNCATCITSDDGTKQICDSCDSGYIPSLDLTTCESCADSCIRCEYVSFSTITNVQYPTRSFSPIDTDLQSHYIKICRQCEQAQDSIHFDGENCSTCIIDNCKLCYYKIQNSSGVWRNTMDLEFIPWNSNDFDPIQLCFVCNEGYVLQDDKKICVLNDNTKIIQYCQQHNLLGDGKYQCVLCQKGYILDSTNGNCYGICSDIIENCLYCMSYRSADIPTYYDIMGDEQKLKSQQLYTCLKCENGFYPDFFTGACLQCLSNCDTCSQYNKNYNFTDYLQQHKIESEFTKSKYLTTELEEPYCSQCQDGYIKYGNTCQGCTDNCVSDNPSTIIDPPPQQIKQCTYTSNGAFCGQCYNSYIDRSLNEDKSECHQCPLQCLACRDRTIAEIQRVNYYFNPSNSLLQKYSRICYIYNSHVKSGKSVTYDTYLNMPVVCSNSGQSGKCNKISLINVNLYCDQNEYTTAKSAATTTDEQRKYMFDLSYFYSISLTSTTNVTFSTLETLEFYQTLNENSITTATLKINLIKNAVDGVKTCKFTSNTNIIVEIQRNVFSIRDMNVEIIGESNPTLPPLIIQIDGVLRVPWTDNLLLKGIELQQAIKPVYQQFGIQIINNTLSKIELNNFKIGRSKKIINESIPILFHFDNVYSLIWNKVYIYNLFETDDFQITYSQNYITQIEYTFDDVTFYQNDFINKILFNPIQSERVKSISISTGNVGITFEKCSLIMSKIFGEGASNTHSSGKSEFKKVVIKFTTFNSSSFFYMNSQNETIFNNIDVIRSNFTESSIFIVSNNFRVQNFYAIKNIIYEGGRFFQNSYKVIDDLWASEASRFFEFNNMNIKNTICYSIVCLIKLSTPLNNYGYQTNITMVDIIIDSSDSFNIDDKETNSVLSALILIQTVQKIQIRNFQSLNNFGITSLAALDIQSFALDQGVYDWTQDQYDRSNNTIQLAPCNNKIPTSSECATRKTNYKSFNQDYIYIANFDIGVSIQNVALRRLLSIDTNFIIIKSWDVDQFNSTRDQAVYEEAAFYHETKIEIIILKNIQVIRNSLVITESRTQLASIFINSDQEQNILIDGCQFSENHLHSLVSDQLSPSSPIFLIQSPLSILHINNSIFDNNRATRVHNSIIYIISYNLTITQCQFSNTNIRKKEWVYRLEEQQMVNQTSNAENTSQIIKQLELFFPINSLGGNFYAKVAIINIKNTIFNQSYAIGGAGAYIQTIDDGIVSIEDTLFQDQYNTLLNEYSSKGGCLYIDSSNSRIELNINRVEMQNCVARQSGGCIYLSSSTQLTSIYIQDSQFTQCQAIQESGISFSFSTSSPILPEVQIKNSVFQENNIANFLRNIPDITLVDAAQLYSVSTFYYQQYGRLSLDQVVFRKFSLISIIQLEYLAELTINNVQVVNNTLFINDLFKISLSSTSGKITITASKFESNIQFTELKVVPNNCTNYFLTYDSSIAMDDQTCPFIEALDDFYRTDVLPLKYITSTSQTYPLYNLETDQAYQILTSQQKYVLSTPDFDQIIQDDLTKQITLNLGFILFQSFLDTENVSFIQCFYTILMSQYTSITSTFQTTLVKITSITEKQSLAIESVTLQNNNCLRCVYGLFQVYKVHQSITSTLNITDFNCYSNIVGYYGCLTLTYNQELVEIEQSLPLTDYKLSDRLLNVVDDLLTQTYVVVLQSCKFVKNKAKVGAGLTMFGLQALIILSEFSDNYSSLIGGAVYYESVPYNGIASSLRLASNTVEGNSAQLAGGLFISGGVIGDVTSIQMFFQNNEGSIRGDNLEEYPSSLTLLMKEGQLMNVETYQSYDGDLNQDGFIDSTTTEIIDIIKLDTYSLFNYENETDYLILPSGQAINSYNYYFSETNEQIPYEWKFRLINLDRFSQPMSNINSTESCKVTGRIMDTNNYNESKEFLSNFTLIQNYAYEAINGVFNLDTLVLTFDPYSESNLFLQLKFVCSSIKIPVYNTVSPYEVIGYNTNYALYANVRTFPCQLGEAYTQEKCKACTKADKTYSVSIYDAQCYVMDSATMDDVNPTNIKLKAGFWRYEFNSSVITECINLPADCNGGWTPGNPSCYTGHMGALCESCDIYGTRDEPYATSAKYKCGQCADTTAVNAIVITALSIVALVSMMLSVKGNYQMLEDFVKTQNKMSMGILVSPQQSNLAILIKLFTTYFQILSAISTFQINLSSGITNASQILGNPTQSMAYSLDCFLVSITSVEILYFRLIWSLVMPLLYLSTFLFGYILAIASKKVEFKEGIIYTAFIYMFLYLQPTLVGGFIGLASQRNIGGLNWVQADVMYQYDTTSHYLWMAAFVAPMLLSWAFLFPCIFMFLVYKMRHKLHDYNNRKKLGYFYNEYTKQGYLWEFVKIFEKELVIIFLTFYEDRVVVKGLVIFVIVFIYGAFTVKFHPYQSNRLNFIDRLSTAICGASLCLGVLIYAAILQDLLYLEVIMIIIVAIINLFFIMLMVYYLFEGYLIKFQPQLDQIRDQLRMNYPDLQEKFPWSRKLLYNQKKMNERVKRLWATLRYETRKGIERKRKDHSAPLFYVDTSEKPVLTPFYIPESKLDKNQSKFIFIREPLRKDDSPGIQKVYPEQIHQALNEESFPLQDKIKE